MLEEYRGVFWSLVWVWFFGLRRLCIYEKGGGADYMSNDLGCYVGLVRYLKKFMNY